LIELTVNEHPISVEEGTTVAAAIYAAGVDHFRRSVSGQPRGPLCGMGVCFECQIIIDGFPQRSCLVVARDGMKVSTGE
jgi:sarcosine oxidase subunit alpha